MRYNSQAFYMLRTFSICLFHLGFVHCAVGSIYLETLGTTLGASISSSYTYESNLEGRSNSASGGTFRITPTFSFSKDDGILVLNGALSSSFSRYLNVEEPEIDRDTDGESTGFVAPNEGETFNDYQANLSASLNEWNDYWSASLAVSFSESNDTDRTEGGIIRTRNYSFGGRVNYRLASRTSLSLSPSFRKSENEGFTNNESLGVTTSISYDYNEALRFSIGGDYRETNVNTVPGVRREVVSVSSTPVEPSTPADSGAPASSPTAPAPRPPEPTEQVVETTELLREERSRDSRDYGLFFSAFGDLTGTLNGNASVGLRQREFEDPTRDPANTTFFDIGLQWSVSDRTTLNFSVGQDFSTTASGQSEESFKASVSTSRSFTPQLTGNLSFAYNTSTITRASEDLTQVTTSRTIPIDENPEDFDSFANQPTSVRTETVPDPNAGSTREDKEWRIGVGLSYRFVALGSLAANVTYSDRTSDDGDQLDFSSYTVSLAYRYQF